MTPRNFNSKLCFLIIIYCLPSIGINKVTAENPLQKSWQCRSNDDGNWQCIELDSEQSKLFKKNIMPKQKKRIIADALGWLSDSDPNNICQGFYYQQPVESNASEEPIIQLQKANYSIGGVVTAEGTVELTQGNQYLSADKAVIKKDSASGALDTIDLSGNVNMRQPGQLAISDSGTANIHNDTAVFNDTYYLIRVRKKPGTLLSATGDQNTKEFENFTGFARGHADEIIQNSKTNYTLKNATYTTAGPYDDDWMLKMDALELDRESGLGTAYNTTLYTQRIPVLYWPYLTFPIDDRRRSGFIYPVFGFNNNSGYYLSTPFYWNIAPQYDLLLTPTIYNHRGVLIDGNFRYLTQTQRGEINGQYMPYDRRAGTHRKAFSIANHGDYGQHWQSYFNYQYVSDKDFYNDFEMDNTGLSTSTLLNREIGGSYKDLNWDINGKFQGYKVADERMLPANRPYWLMPQINAKATYPALLSSVNLNWDNQITYFYKPSVSGQSQMQAQRFYSAPEIKFPIQKSWGFLNSSVTLSEALYTLQNRGVKYPEQHILRSLPIFSVDSGVYLDRSFTFKDHKYTQTLEPRLFYTYIPYRDQSNIPLFDTSLSNFSYASLFTSDLFTGIDRINNANQLAYALETKINSAETGQDLLSAGIGQIVYFADREVSLADKKVLFHDANFSDIAAKLSYRFLPDWQLISDATYNTQNNNVDSQNYQIQYMPDANHIFNISYQNIKNNYATLTPEQIQKDITPDPLSQVAFSALWQLTPHWSVAGLWSYGFTTRHTSNMFAAIQYDSCSWAIRLLAQRHISASSDPNTPSKISGPLNNTYMVQFELKGLGGTTRTSLDRNLAMINGYSDKSRFN